MNIEIRRFVKACAIVVLSLAAIDVGLGCLFDRLFQQLPVREKQPSAISHSYSDTPDVALFGSSRCHHHFVTRQLADSIAAFWGCPVEAYNYGLDAIYANNHLCAIEAMLHRHTPKLIILEVGSHEFDRVYTRTVECASPLYRHNAVVRQYINQADAANRFLMLSSMYRYRNALPLRIAETFTASPDSNRGYCPLFRQMDTNAVYGTGDRPEDFVPDTIIVSNFRRVARLCSQKGVLFVAALTPRYHATFFPPFAKEVCLSCGVPFIDLRTTDLFDSHSDYFYDPAHLNHEGATIFTAMFFEKLKPYLCRVAEQ